MAKYYCHECSIKMGELNNEIKDFNPTGTKYQLEKFVKHTVPSAQSHAISIFDRSEGKPFKDYFLNTLASGCIEIDDEDRKNFIWIAGKKQGYSFAGGHIQGDEDGVKVVLPDDPDKIHAFAIAGSSLSITNCIRCGKEIIF